MHDGGDDVISVESDEEDCALARGGGSGRKRRRDNSGENSGGGSCFLGTLQGAFGAVSRVATQVTQALSPGEPTVEIVRLPLVEAWVGIERLPRPPSSSLELLVFGRKGDSSYPRIQVVATGTADNPIISVKPCALTDVAFYARAVATQDDFPPFFSLRTHDNTRSSTGLKHKVRQQALVSSRFHVKSSLGSQVCGFPPRACCLQFAGR